MLVLAVPARVADQQQKARRRRLPVVEGVVDEVANGARIGDTVAWRRPAGDLDIEVEAIEPPAPDRDAA